jgi:hypothetical protein
LDEEMKKLAAALSQEGPTSLEKLITQINQIVAGTHNAVPIQSPEVKKNTKGRPPTKKASSTSTKQNTSAFELVEEKLQKKQIAKIRLLEALEHKSKQIKKNVDYKEGEEEEEPTVTTKDTDQSSSHHEAGPVSSNSDPDGGAIMPIEVILQSITLISKHSANNLFSILHLIELCFTDSSISSTACQINL